MNELLANIVEAHGGLDRWRRVNRVVATIVTGGALWGMKNLTQDQDPRKMSVSLHEEIASVAPFGDPDWTMTWTPEHVEVTNSKGTIISERDHGRDAFDRSYDAPWNPLNLAYFNGYAMWTYHAFPFVFAEPGYKAHEIEPIAHEGEMLRGLSVRLPEGVHSHTREQRFYFGSDGLLRRHDYEVDVWADTPAAHFLSEYVDVNGLKFPHRRSVFVRRPDGRPDWDLNLVTIDLSDYTLF